MAKRLVLAMSAAMIAGCAVGPSYEKPALENKAAGKWGEASSDKVSSQQIQLVQWWTVFKDERLAALVDRAVAANFDLALAESRVREARAEYRAAVGDFLPTVDASASATRQRLSENGSQNVGGFSPPLYSTLYQAGFDAGWEIDVFGGKRRAIEAASASLEASVEDRRAVLVSLLGEVARNYLVLRGSQRQIAVIRANVRSAGETLELTRTRLRGGLGTDLDVARAEGQLATTTSLIPSLETQLRQAAHRLGLLLGLEPNALKAELLPEAAVPAPPPVVAVGIPSDLLARRPDVRRAERELAAATARVGVATADLYPKFSIGAFLGLASVSSGDLLKWQSRAWSIGPSVVFPLFHGGQIRANIEVQSARQEQARIGFEKAFLGALGEVEDALVAYLQEGERRKSIAEAVASNERAVRLVSDRYTKGLTAFLDVLEAERSLYGTQQQLAQSDVQLSLNLVALYKALGGGWQE